MSLNCGVIIQARMSSSRFRGKSLAKVGGIPLIMRVVDRLRLLKLPIVVAISDHDSDDILYHYLRSENIEVFRGDLFNVRRRFICAARHYGFERILRINGDSPFVNVEFLSKKFHTYDRYKYVDAIHNKGLLYGTGFEIVNLNELLLIPDGDSFSNEHVTIYLRENAKRDYLKVIPPSEIAYKAQLYLTIDYEEDLLFCNEILKNTKSLHPSVDEILNILASNASIFDMRSQIER